jgi:hypothetical protein
MHVLYNSIYYPVVPTYSIIVFNKKYFKKIIQKNHWLL